MLPKTFCCCFSTRIGCIAIGYITGSLSVALCVGSIIRLFLGLPLILQNDDFQGEFPFNPLFFVFSAVYFGFHTVTSFGLIPAVKEGQGIIVIPTLVMLSMDIVLSFIGLTVVSIMLDTNDDEFHDYFVSGIAIGSILLPSLMYFILIVASEFEEIFGSYETDLSHTSDAESLHKEKIVPKEMSQDTSCGTIV